MKKAMDPAPNVMYASAANLLPEGNFLLLANWTSSLVLKSEYGGNLALPRVVPMTSYVLRKTALGWLKVSYENFPW